MNLIRAGEDAMPISAPCRREPRSRPIVRKRIAGVAITLLLILGSPIFGSQILGGASVAEARGDALSIGIAAFNRHAYVTAARIFLPLAERGNARAQTYLGFMYAYGRGVPQNYEVSARLYQSAAEQGIPLAQYMLGLMWDKGQGVPQDYVAAYTWVNLAVASSAGRDREYWTRVRDAIGSKLSLAERTLAQRLSVDWQAARGR
ncbi:Sel1 repeat-containing protein [Rhizobiales bacterium GAS113]|nr:Sel1 repeat-containing protein [Rhizobiales bacterium GAS113]